MINIEKNKDLDAKETLMIFLYCKIFKEKNDINFIKKGEYDNFKLSEELIDEFNKSQTVQSKILKWINDYPKVANYFYNYIFFKKAIIWKDRKKTDYFTEKLQLGFEFEEYICNFFLKNYDFKIETYKTQKGQYELGETIQGIEIKNDALMKETGNIYIELYERSSPFQKVWIKSGILKRDKTIFYLIGDRDVFYIFLKEDLLKIYSEKKFFRETGNPTSKGFLLKVSKITHLSYTPEKMIEYLNKK